MPGTAPPALAATTSRRAYSHNRANALAPTARGTGLTTGLNAAVAGAAPKAPPP